MQHRREPFEYITQGDFVTLRSSKVYRLFLDRLISLARFSRSPGLDIRQLSDEVNRAVFLQMLYRNFDRGLVRARCLTSGVVFHENLAYSEM